MFLTHDSHISSHKNSSTACSNCDSLHPEGLQPSVRAEILSIELISCLENYTPTVPSAWNIPPSRPLAGPVGTAFGSWLECHLSRSLLTCPSSGTPSILSSNDHTHHCIMFACLTGKMFGNIAVRTVVLVNGPGFRNWRNVSLKELEQSLISQIKGLRSGAEPCKVNGGVARGNPCWLGSERLHVE